MIQLRDFVVLYNVEIIIGLIATLFLLLVLYLVAEIRLSKLKKRYDNFTRGIKNINIEELLIKLGEDINNLQIDMNGFEETIRKLDTRLAFAIQKIGFIRYNAFGDMGSDLSFSIALLDDFKNGFVITSIYGRDYTTSYAKPIKLGKSIYPLSVEEMQALDRAIMGEYTEKA